MNRDIRHQSAAERYRLSYEEFFYFWEIAKNRGQILVGSVLRHNGKFMLDPIPDGSKKVLAKKIPPPGSKRGRKTMEIQPYEIQWMEECAVPLQWHQHEFGFATEQPAHTAGEGMPDVS